MKFWKALQRRFGQRPTLSVNVSDTVTARAGLQLGVFGPSANGGQKVGARRSDWFETKGSAELDTATRFSRFTGNDLTEFQQPTQDDDVDVVGRTGDRSKMEEFQIVRLWNDLYWKQLNTKDAIDQELSLDELCALIQQKIQNKADKYASERRRSLVLLIDTNPTPVLPALIPNIKTTLAQTITLSGFKSVWLVGGEKDHIHQLG